MATPKEIKKRIHAVQNTKKITKTMEMVATAKAKRTVDRVNHSGAYVKRIEKLLQLVIGSLSYLNTKIEHPLLESPKDISRVGLLVVSANRGLCGGFNNSVIKLAQKRIKELESNNIDTCIHLIGKKVISIFDFLEIPYEKGYTHIEDKPTFKEAIEFADHFMEKFKKAEIDQFEIISTFYVNSSLQVPKIRSILPFNKESFLEEIMSGVDEQEKDISSKDASIFEPSAEQILMSLLPQYIRIQTFQSILQSSASEQVARKIAMKNATENATEIIHEMTRLYNRVRQAKITQEIAEIVGGTVGV